jgi:penicillin-binding protein 1A
MGNWCPRNYSGGYSGAVTLTTAIVKSVNVVPVRLTNSIENGRAKIIELAKRMGVQTELHSSKSLPLGASEVTVLDQATGYSVFANGGYKVTPYAFTQIMTSTGEVVYDRRKDVPPAERVLDDETVKSMNTMLSQVPEWGTGRRAKLEGIKTAGKTGTTSAYRDAWFVGFTGNYTGAVWMGNDGYAPTRRLTGGVLPATIWNKLMTYAHHGIPIKPIPFIEPEPPPEGEALEVAEADAEADTPDASLPASVLTALTTTRLTQIERLFETAPKLRPVADLGVSMPVSVAATPEAGEPSPTLAQ